MDNELAKTIAREKDKFLFELFKKHGYHLATVMKLLHKGRITALVQGDIEIYCVDNKELFTIKKVVQFDDENHKVTFYFTEVVADEDGKQS